MQTNEFYSKNSHQERLVELEELIELSNKELKALEPRVERTLEKVVGLLTQQNFVDEYGNVFTAKIWSLPSEGKYPEVEERYFFNGVRTSATTPVARMLF